MLLKPRVYLHLLFNRDSEPERAGQTKDSVVVQRKHGLWWDLTRLAVLNVAAETCVRQMST